MSGPPAGFFESFGSVAAAPAADLEEITTGRIECTTKETLVDAAAEYSHLINGELVVRSLPLCLRVPTSDAAAAPHCGRTL